MFSRYMHVLLIEYIRIQWPGDAGRPQTKMQIAPFCMHPHKNEEKITSLKF